MKQNVKQTFETVAVAMLCLVFVLSMHQSCSGLMNKSDKQEKNKIKKAQELKNNTINTFKLTQNIR